MNFVYDYIVPFAALALGIYCLISVTVNEHVINELLADVKSLKNRINDLESKLKDLQNKDT